MSEHSLVVERDDVHRQMMLIVGRSVGTLCLGLWAELLQQVLSVLMREESETVVPFFLLSSVAG